MTANTAKISTNLKIELQPLLKDKSVVLLNGKAYEFSVFKFAGKDASKNDNFEDITTNEWKDIAVKVGEFIRERINNNHFEEARIVLKGSATSITPQALKDQDNEITVDSAKVKYIDPQTRAPVELSLEKPATVVFKELNKFKPKFVHPTNIEETKATVEEVEVQQTIKQEISKNKQTVETIDNEFQEKTRNTPVPAAQIFAEQEETELTLPSSNRIADGNSLPIAISSQLMKKMDPKFDHNELERTHENLKIHSNMLRRLAAKEILNQKSDQEFFKALQDSIKNIPEFKNENENEMKKLIESIPSLNDKDVKEIEGFWAFYKNGYRAFSEEIYNKIRNTLNKQYPNEENINKTFTDIKNVLKKKFEDTTPEERKLLKTFYANYICLKNSLGEMDKPPGLPFLMVLPKIHDKHKATFSNGINCVIHYPDDPVKKIKKFGKTEKLNKEDWVFVKYCDNCYYQQIDDDKIIDNIIEEENKKYSATTEDPDSSDDEYFTSEG